MVGALVRRASGVAARHGAAVRRFRLGAAKKFQARLSATAGAWAVQLEGLSGEMQRARQPGSQLAGGRGRLRPKRERRGCIGLPRAELLG